MAGETPRPRSRVWAIVVAVVALGLIATTLGAWAVERAQHRAQQAGADRYSALAGHAVQAEVNRYLDTATAVAASLAAQEDLRAGDFDVVTAPLLDARLAGASGISFVVPARTDQLAAVQDTWRAQGAVGLTLKPAAIGENWFSIFGRALDGGTLTTGTDLGQVAPLREALLKAQRTGRTAVSSAYVLLRDQNKPVAGQQQSFVIVAPVPDIDAVGLRGWVIMGLRSGDLLRGTLQESTQNQADALLTAENGTPGRSRVVAQTDAGPATDRSLERSSTIQVADRSWLLTVHTTDSAADRDAGGAHIVPAALAIGALLTAMLAVILWLALTARARALVAVDEATAELREAEAYARQQATLLNAVMESIDDGVGVIDSHGRAVMANSSARRLTGIDPDPGEHLDPHAIEVFLPDRVTPFPTEQRPAYMALNGRASGQVQMFMRHPGNPKGLPLMVSARPLDPSGGISGAVIAYHDISQLVDAQADLRASEARRRAILDNAPDAFVGMDEDGLVTDWNPAATALLGWAAEEALGRPMRELIVPEAQREQHVAAVHKFLGTGETSLPPHPVELEARHRDGYLIPIELGVSRMPWHGGWRFYGFIRDISGRRAAAEELRAAEQQFRFAFDHAHVGMAMTALTPEGSPLADVSGLLRVNDALCAMLGYSRAELSERSLVDVTHPEDRDLGPLVDRDGITSPDSILAERRYLHADGHTVLAREVTTTIRDGEGRPLFAILQIEDVTERRAETERLRGMALHDPLTGLGNRVLLDDRLRQAAARSARTLRPIGIVYCDLDGFKPVNDVHGHAAGDAVLQEAAGRLRDTVRAADTVVRAGGDEFVILCEDLDGPEAIEPVTDRIRRAFERPFTLPDGQRVSIGCSTGSATAGGPEVDVDHLMHFADAAMYVTKRTRRAART